MGEDTKTVVEQEQDDFSVAFADLAINLKEPGAAAATETPEAKAAREAAAAAAATAAAATETPEAKAAREAAATAATETPEAKAAREAAATAATAAAATASQPDAAVLAAQLATAQAELEKLRTAPAVTETPEAKAAREAAVTAAAKPLYTTEEQTLLDKYVAEWDVVKKGEELIRRGEYKQLVSYIFEQVQAVYGPALQYVEARSGKDQYSDIKSLVPDYDQVRDPTIAWVNKQPAFLKSAYSKVITEGTPEDVRDLIHIFKQATGAPITAAAAPATATAAPAGGMATAAAPADAAKAAALAALKPVGSERTTQTQGADPSNFDASFAEFAK